MNFKDFVIRESFNDVKKSLLNEATFSEQNLSRVMQLYGRLFAKHFGGKFHFIGEENFKRADSKGVGARFINDLGYQLRFNWDKSEIRTLKAQDKEARGKQLYLSSIDYWEPMNTDFAKPTSTLIFLQELNVVQIWEKASKLLKRGVKGKYKLSSLIEMNEASAYDVQDSEKKEFLKRNGFKSSIVYNTNKKQLQNMLDQDPELQAKFDDFVIEIKAGKQETNDFDNDLKKTEKQLEETVYCDPELVFEDIELMTEFIGKKGSKSLIICGQAGVGKTFHVTETLKKLLGQEGLGWNYHSGMKTTPFSIYRTIFQERFKTIVFDEADSMLKNPDIIVQLKPALDTSGKNTLEYSNGTVSMIGKTEEEIKEYCKEVDAALAEGKILGVSSKGGQVQAPSKFYFEGQLILISNMPASKIDEAIMSRSLFIDVHLCAQDINKRIETIMLAKYGNEMSREEIDEIMEALGSNLKNVVNRPNVQYMTPEIARKNKAVTVRSMDLAIKMKRLGVKNWIRLSSLYA